VITGFEICILQITFILMSTFFYDEKEAKIDNRIKTLNQRVSKLQKLSNYARGYLRLSEQRFGNYNSLENQAIGVGLGNAHRDARVKVVAGVAVGAITLWELIKGTRALYKWLRRELTPKEESDSRLHARDWKRAKESSFCESCE
jgi:hypothetical protein